MSSARGGDALCSCEQISHSELGAVDDAERLARVVISPRHVSKRDGSIKPGLFPHGHIKDRGLSLMRVDRMANDELAMHADVIATFKPGDTVAGACLCVARALRGIVGDDGRRSLCVKDDPVKDDSKLPDNPAHAIAIRSSTQDGDEITRIRTELTMLFDGLISITGANKSHL